MANYTMKDIARMSGVSVATVSRAINNNGYVSEDNRKKIEAILEETGFVPNRIAAGLKRHESMLIGHLTVFNSNMQYEKISASINGSAISKGYHVITMTSHGDIHEERSMIDQMIGQQVDGVIITSNHNIPKKLIEKLVKAQIPVVMIERTMTLPCVDCIVVDDYQGAYEAVDHLIKKGHDRIGYIGVEPLKAVEQRRYKGYLGALEVYKIDQDESIQYFCEAYTASNGRLGAKQLLEAKNPPTAIFATSDLLASGVLQYCYQNKITIPEQLSLIGYDDTLSVLLAPNVSSMALPEDNIGEEAIQLIMKRIENRDNTSKEVLIRPYLVERETVTAPKQ